MKSINQDNKNSGNSVDKVGIALQTSAPLYSKRHYGPIPSRHDHNHKQSGIADQNRYNVTNIPTVQCTTKQADVNFSNVQNVNGFVNQHNLSQEIAHKPNHNNNYSYNYDHTHQHEVMKSDNHQHNNYIDDHHDHVHKHNIHQHNHSFSPVYTPPLPSWFQVFSHLAPIQKTIFTWFLIHGSIGIWLYCIGVSLESLSLVGFSYLMLFDALGVLNLFISSVLKTQSAFSISNIKQPFGAHRYEIVFALGTNIYLLFATMHNTKESLEHFLLESHHVQEEHENGEHHTKLTLGMFLLMGFAITATCLSSITLGNHDNFVRYLRKRPTIVHGIVYSVINRARGNPIHVLLSNIYSSSIALCGSVILLFYMFGAATPFFDKMLALFESVVMFYLGYPTAKALAKILLQTTPIAVQNGVENRLREILQDPNIIHVNHTHCWQITYGKCVGTIEIQIKPEADDQAILRFVYQKLEGLTSNNFETSGNNSSELTVSIVK